MSTQVPPALEQIDSEDKNSRVHRAQRLQELLDAQPPKRIFPSADTWEATFAFQEAMTAYVNGTFFGCILLSQACLEQLLADRLMSMKESGLKNIGFQTLLKKAKDKGLITESEFSLFDSLRQKRNPSTHYRLPNDKRKLSQRALRADESMMHILAEDSKASILSLIQICRRPPFAEDFFQEESL